MGETEIPNVYSKTVVNNVTVNNISYNGGPSGLPRNRARKSSRRPANRTLQLSHEPDVGNGLRRLGACGDGGIPSRVSKSSKQLDQVRRHLWIRDALLLVCWLHRCWRR